MNSISRNRNVMHHLQIRNYFNYRQVECHKSSWDDLFLTTFYNMMRKDYIISNG